VQLITPIHFVVVTPRNGKAVALCRARPTKPDTLASLSGYFILRGRDAGFGSYRSAQGPEHREHIEGDTGVTVLLFANAINCPLHLPMATSAALLAGVASRAVPQGGAASERTKVGVL
jgi:hypothetical protein